MSKGCRLREFQESDGDYRRLMPMADNENSYKVDNGVLTKIVVTKGVSVPRIVVPATLRDTVYAMTRLVIWILRKPRMR